MDPERSPPALGQHIEIAARLRRFYHAETIFLPRHGQILRLVAGDLEEHTAIRAALIGLSGRMQEARSELEAGGDALAVANHHPQRLQHGNMRRLALDIGENGAIIAGPKTREMRAEPPGQ